MKIAIIGAGWYGCHLALALAKNGHEVSIFEKNNDIFSGISGQFGIRLHSGSHYPRSSETRDSCRRDFNEFKRQYPELVVGHQYSIYGLGKRDSVGEPSHVSSEIFNNVCAEFQENTAIKPSTWGYSNLLSAHNLDEPSILIGKTLREFFRCKLKEHDIQLVFNAKITDVNSHENGVNFEVKSEKYCFDKLINASSFQSLLPKDIPPFPFEVVYQTCLGLVYEDLEIEEKPFSFIVMDGFFPCLMPVLNAKTDNRHHYLLTHGQYTIMASCSTPEEAQKILDKIDEDYIEEKIKPRCEYEMNRFWPAFSERFQYKCWQGNVLAKLKTKTEFRSALTFEKDNIIYIIPGKVSNIFEVENETIALLNNLGIKTYHGYRFVTGGVLDHGLSEIITPPEGKRATTNLQTYHELNEEKNHTQFQHI